MAKESYGTIYKGDREQLDLCKAEKLYIIQVAIVAHICIYSIWQAVLV